MTDRTTHMVTGAFGFTGKYIAQHLLQQGLPVKTMTNSIDRQNVFHNRVKAVPFHFDNYSQLVKSLADISTLYNTYWVRFNHKKFSHKEAVDNTLKLFEAAKDAGVEKIVHTSITNPSLESELEYFQGKAILEQALIESGMSYSILRPAVIFGREDILINNITWLLRKMPFFPVFGYGSYRIQPIYVKDFAKLAVQEGTNPANTIINAIGPETYSYKSLIEKLGDIIGISKPIIRVSPSSGYLIGKVVSRLVRDVVITREEIIGLMADLLCVDDSPTGDTKLSEWVSRHKDSLGNRYASELARRTSRGRACA